MPPAAPATTSGQALQNLQTAQSSQQTPQQITQGNDQSLGIPQEQQTVSGLRQAITNTTNLLNGVAPSVQGRTANSLVTSAQAEKQISNEQAPISQELSGQNTSLSNDTSDLNSLLSEASAEDTADETAQSDSLTNLQNIYNDLYGQEQNTAAAQQKAAEDAEAEREFNVSQANTAAANSAKASTPTAAETQQADMAGAAQYLQGLSGSDGHVSQGTWNQAMAQWTAAGYKATDFVSQFKQYINQKYTGYHGFD